MSDPVKNVEIEDVLSSIRRLLADGEGQGDSRPAAAPQPVDTAPRAAVAPSRVRSERRADAPLVLTPALRVAGRPEGAAEPTPFPGSQAGPAAEAAGSDDDFEAPDLPDASGGSLRSRLKETIAELEAAITHQADDWEPDGSETAPVMDWQGTRPEDTPFLSRRHAATAEAAQPEPAAPREVPDAPREAPQAPAAEAGFHDGLAEETAFEAPRAEAVPAPLQPVETAPPAAEPAAEDEADRAPEAVEAEPDALQVPEGPSAAIDEEMLRRLIAEVLREELRGPLGDRITGNLRKLVRREIFRALASGDFE
ncbi:hypothetical protein [Limimaricola sp.]|uniref:hypothetical protein n=1 Tax=Limimaricola sp. TaxID=2211665 RepID=UPI004057ED18